MHQFDAAGAGAGAPVAPVAPVEPAEPVAPVAPAGPGTGTGTATVAAGTVTTVGDEGVVRSQAAKPKVEASANVAKRVRFIEMSF
jgi:hypothetical protein